MTDSESTRAASRKKTHASSRGFPVFKKIFRLLVGIAFVAPVLASVLNWLLIEQFKGEPWSVGLAIGVLLALIAVILVWMITQRLKRPLEELMGSLNRVADGQYDEHFNPQGTQDLVELAEAFNNLTTSLLIAREAMMDRDQLQQVLDGIPDPLVVLDGNGVVELSNRRFNELLRRRIVLTWQRCGHTVG